MCQQHKFELERRISKRFIRTQYFLQITPTTLEENSPVLTEFEKKNTKVASSSVSPTPSR